MTGILPYRAATDTATGSSYEMSFPERTVDDTMWQTFHVPDEHLLSQFDDIIPTREQLAGPAYNKSNREFNRRLRTKGAFGRPRNGRHQRHLHH